MAQKKLKIFVVAGEASGDIYGGLFAENAMEITGVDIELRGWGGEQMANAGVKVTKHYRELAFMGFVEVIKNLRTIKNNLNQCFKEIVEFRPDAVVFIDLPGFNMRVAKRLRNKIKANDDDLQLNTKLFQLVCPQIWAWKSGRIKDLKRDYDCVFPVLPFEDSILKSGGVNSQSMGHPLLDSILKEKSARKGVKKEKKEKLIALLPGSRKQEINKILPVYLQAIKDFPDHEVVIAGAPGLEKSDYTLAEKAGLRVEFGKTRELLQRAEAAVITSGTATLEAALLKVKHVIAYKTSALNFAIAKALVDVDFIGLPNLILGRKAVEELIQGDCNPQKISEELRKALSSSDMEKDFDEIYETLGNGGASKRIAEYVVREVS